MPLRPYSHSIKNNRLLQLIRHCFYLIGLYFGHSILQPLSGTVLDGQITNFIIQVSKLGLFNAALWKVL